MALFEAVPNISEGRQTAIIDACSDAVQQAGARVIHRTSDAIHNRSVLTVLGSYNELATGCVALAGVASERIDLRMHQGIHPRIGALDVLPFVPLAGARMEEAVELARETGARIWNRYQIPSFLYGRAAVTPQRANLASVRSGQFEGLDARFERPEWKPDFGDPRAHTTAGAIAIGAREILIAFNVELRSGDLDLAKRIARQIRHSSGGLTTLKALGLRLNDQVVQVSLNITDYAATPLHRVVAVIGTLAAEHGVEILRCELIGCIPQEAVRDAAEYYIGLKATPVQS